MGVTHPLLRLPSSTYSWENVSKGCTCGSWKSKRRKLSFNIAGFRIHIVVILKANSHMDLKVGEGGRETWRGSSEAESCLPPWQASSAWPPGTEACGACNLSL